MNSHPVKEAMISLVNFLTLFAPTLSTLLFVQISTISIVLLDTLTVFLLG
jgi:hypothetical protein